MQRSSCIKNRSLTSRNKHLKIFRRTLIHLFNTMYEDNLSTKYCIWQFSELLLQKLVNRYRKFTAINCFVKVIHIPQRSLIMRDFYVWGTKSE